MISIVGAKNSGKTTLIEKLLKFFNSRNINTVTIKHTSHEHHFDQPGKDTFRHRSAGANSTIAIGQDSFALFGVTDALVRQKVIDVISESADLCLIEGDKLSDSPKIVITNEIQNLDINKISNIVCSFGEKKLNSHIAHFNNHEVNKLGEFILNIDEDLSME